MRTQPIDMANYLVLETSDLQASNSDGSMTVPDGEEVTLVEYEPTDGDTTVLLHALGATNLLDVQYKLAYGQDVSHVSEAPPGGYTDPLSYTKQFGAPLTSEDTVQYRAINKSGQDQELVAVMHVEIDETPGPPQFLRQAPAQRQRGGN